MEDETDYNSYSEWDEDREDEKCPFYCDEAKYDAIDYANGNTSHSKFNRNY